MLAQKLERAAVGIDLIDAAIHAGGVERYRVGGDIQAQHGGRKLVNFTLVCLHGGNLAFFHQARISRMAAALSSTRWNVGKLGMSYSAYGSMPSAEKMVAKRVFFLTAVSIGS